MKKKISKFSTGCREQVAARRRSWSLFLICSLFLFLVGCGFHLRNAANIPPQLKILFLAVDKPDTPFNQALRHLLISLQIHLTQKSDQAPLQLRVTYDFTHSTPEIVSSTQTVTYVYSLHVEASILNTQGIVIVPVHIIDLTRTLSMNTTQIYTPNTASIVQNELERDAINLLYYWLTNTATQTALIAPHPETPPPPAQVTAPSAAISVTPPAHITTPSAPPQIPTTNSQPCSLNEIGKSPKNYGQ